MKPENTDTPLEADCPSAPCSRSFADLLESLDAWIEDALKNSKPIGLTLSRARVTITDQHDRIGELLDALERQNKAVEKMRSVLSGIAKANPTDWEIPRSQFKEDFLPWAQNVARGALDSSSNATAQAPIPAPKDL
jgi:hypothetical protein